MVRSTINLSKKVRLQNPIMIEGLPGTGFVANLSTAYLINELKAEKLAEIRSPYFQDFAVSLSDGTPRFPVNELYVCKSVEGERDLIILHGNTQALTVFGQYELSGRFLDFIQDLGCDFIICLGGLNREKPTDYPQLYGAFTDLETRREVQQYGLNLIKGRIFGMAGLLLGLASLRKMKGFCLLAETLGTYPDAVAAKEILSFLMRYLGFNIDWKKFGEVTKDTFKVLELFSGMTKPKIKEEFFRRF